MAFNQVTPTSLTPSRPAPQAPKYVNNAPSMALSASSGSNPSYSLSSSSPSASSYAASYSGIGASPNRQQRDLPSDSHVVRSGTVSVKDDGFTSWIWRPKWLVLKEQTLSIHKTVVRLFPSPYHPSVRAIVSSVLPRHVRGVSTPCCHHLRLGTRLLVPLHRP